MRYEVIGANRADGSDVARVYEAADEETAIRRANADGIVVQSVDLLIDFGQAAAVATPSLADAVKMRERAAAERAAAERAAAAKPKPSAAAKSAVDQRGAIAGTSVPDYRGLRMAGHTLFAGATLCYVAAVVMFIATLGSIGARSEVWSGVVGASGLGGRSALVIFWLSSFAPTLALLVVGATVHALSGACVAFRDIARNSWNPRSPAQP